MHFVAPTFTSLYGAMAAAAVSGTTGFEYDDEAYQIWAQAMSGYASDTNSEGLPSVNFWLVIRLNIKGFSDTIEMHPKLPMMIPKEGPGALVGIARNQEELSGMVGKETHKYVYLTYKIKLQGQHAWRILLDFMGEHNMLERQDI